MGDRLATIDMGHKVEAVVPPFSRGRAGSPSNTMLPGPRPTSVSSSMLIHPAVWPQQTWAENWRAVPPFFGGARSLSDTTWPGPRPISLPSGILIHPTVWPQYNNVTDKQRQPGRTVQTTTIRGQGACDGQTPDHSIYHTDICVAR